jgi:hypothetical protein
MRLSTLIGFSCVVLASPWAGYGQTTVNLSALKDNTLYQDVNGDTSNGAGEFFFSGKNSTIGGFKLRRGVIAFNLSSIPVGSTILSATLTLHMSQTSSGSQSIGIHTLTKNWGEGSSDASGNEGQGAPATTNDATWIHTYYNSQFWTSAGGDFNSTASATTNVNATGFYNWSSATVTADVQNWVNTPANNFGWLVKNVNETPSQTAKRFDSRENANTSFRPVLQVTYCPPAMVVINEVDYDQPSTDSSEFIELYNAGSCAENLDPYQVVLVNGSGGGAAIYQTIDLPNVTLSPGDWYVICANNTKTVNCDLDVTPNVDLIQNGAPDAIGLLKSSVLVDAVSYEGNTGAPYTEGSGTSLDDISSNVQYGLSRTPDGDDSNVNNNDFQGSCITPGFANITNGSNCAVNASAGPNKAICLGAQTQIGGSPTGSGGTPPYSYLWTPSAGLSNPVIANPNANPGSTTTYIVRVTDQAGSVDRDTMVLTVNPLPSVSVNANPTSICLGDSSTLTASGALTYDWAPSGTLSSSTGNPVFAFPTSNTIYTVTGTDANGCKDIETVPVQVKPMPTVDAGSDQQICPGDSAQLGATGAVSYVWTPAAGLSCTSCPDPMAAPSADQIYTVTGTAANGCTDEDEVSVSFFPAPIVDGGPDESVCLGSCVVITASGALTYVWTPAGGLSCTNCQSPNACPTVTTTYTVTGTDPNGCEDTATVVVTVLPVPTADAGPDVAICRGSFAIIGGSPTGSGGTPPYSYQWSPIAFLNDPTIANPTAVPASTTTYTVTVTDANSCQDQDEVTVTVNALPSISAGQDQTVCPGECGQLQATDGVSYVWDPDPTLSCTTCSNPLACPTVTTTYYVTGTGANGCTARDTIVITVSSSISVSVNPPTPAICTGESVQLTASGASVYSWTPSSGLSCSNCPDPLASPTSTTTYTVIGSSGPCADTVTVTVTVNPLPTVDAGTNASMCPGQSVQLNASCSGTCSWAPANGLSSVSTCNPMASPTSTTTYTLTCADANSCQATDIVTVTVFPLPPVNAGPDKVICNGDSVQLNGSGAQQFSWAPGSTLTCTTCSSPFAFPAATTVYTLTGTSGNGCQRADSATVTVNPLPVVVAGPDVEICFGESIALTVGGTGAACMWSPGGLSGDTVIVVPATTTTYSVTCIDANSCSNSDVVTVTVNPLPVVDAGSDVSINEGGSTQLSATGAVAYSWLPVTGLSDPNIADPLASPDATTCYTVTGTDANGCVDSDEVCITVIVGIDDLQLLTWSLFPNPANNLVTVSGKLVAGMATVAVRNVLGELVTEIRTIPGGDFSVEFELSGLSTGWYAVVVVADGSVYQKPLILE